MKRQLIHSLAEIWSDHHDESEHSTIFAQVITDLAEDPYDAIEHGKMAATREDIALSDAEVLERREQYEYADAVWYSI
jgi:hypothetical protein